jgi:hypothetical protein
MEGGPEARHPPNARLKQIREAAQRVQRLVIARELFR